MQISPFIFCKWIRRIFGQSIVKSNESSTYRALTPDALVYRKDTLIKMIKNMNNGIKFLIVSSHGDAYAVF